MVCCSADKSQYNKLHYCLKTILSTKMRTKNIMLKKLWRQATALLSELLVNPSLNKDRVHHHWILSHAWIDIILLVVWKIKLHSIKIRQIIAEINKWIQILRVSDNRSCKKYPKEGKNQKVMWKIKTKNHVTKLHSY